MSWNSEKHRENGGTHNSGGNRDTADRGMGRDRDRDGREKQREASAKAKRERDDKAKATRERKAREKKARDNRMRELNKEIDNTTNKDVAKTENKAKQLSGARNTIKERFTDQRKSWTKDRDERASSVNEERTLNKPDKVSTKLDKVEPIRIKKPDYKIEPKQLDKDAYNEAKETWDIRDEVSEPVVRDQDPITITTEKRDKNTNVKSTTGEDEITGIDIAKKIEENQDWSETSRAYLLNKKRNTGGIFGLNEAKMGSKSKAYGSGLRGLFGRGR